MEKLSWKNQKTPKKKEPEPDDAQRIRELKEMIAKQHRRHMEDEDD